MIRRHPVVASLVFLVTATVLAESVWFGRFRDRALYVAAMACSVLLTDFAVNRGGVRPDPLPVRRPMLEFIFALACLLITTALLMNFSRWHWQSGSPASKIAWVISMVFFQSSIPLLLFFVLVMRYRFKEVGFRFAGLSAAVLILLCFAGIASASHGWLWQRAHVSPMVGIQLVMQELGVRSVLAFLCELLFVVFSEEFLRLTWQTRLGAVLNNNAAGQFIAAVLWSLLHFPVHGLHPCLEAVPEGLLWGYIMFRTRSLLPTMLLHGTNFLWGFRTSWM